MAMEKPRRIFQGRKDLGGEQDELLTLVCKERRGNVKMELRLVREISQGSLVDVVITWTT